MTEAQKQAIYDQKLREIRDHRYSQITKDQLDYLYVKFPHKNEWKRYYVRYVNAQLVFCPNVRVSLG